MAGDSAGANLALAAMSRLQEEGGELPATGLLFYGVYGADFTTPSYRDFADGPGLTRAKMQRFWDWYAPKDVRHLPSVAPLQADDTQLRALPPLYLNAAGLDPLRSETMQMGSLLPEAQNAFALAGRYFKQQTALTEHSK